MKTARGERNIGWGSIVLAIIGTCGLGLGLTVAPAPPAGQSARIEPLALTYVANSGVLVGAGQSKVLVDALFDKPNPEYRAPLRKSSTRS
jgi:hypothetical protein